MVTIRLSLFSILLLIKFEFKFCCQVNLCLFLTAVRKVVPENLTSKLGKELQISSRSNSFSAREGPRMSAKNYQTPKIASCVESKDKATTQVRSGKESTAVSSGEKKCIMVITKIHFFMHTLTFPKVVQYTFFC